MRKVHHRRLNREAGLALVAAWHRRRSVQTRASFCRESGVGPWVLKYWLVRESDTASTGFVEVTTPSRSHALEVSIGSALVQIRPGFDPVLLRSVVAALAEVERAPC